MGEKNKMVYIYTLESETSTQELPVDEEDVLTNADGELDCPLDRVLRKNHLEIKDLFRMGVSTVSLDELNCSQRRRVHSISFKHLTYVS
ncbi:hypothetical protein [Lacticigenium naphthae]|uniref:hypothetical protein n=1 Tax=Lacticigenium naphthae TaxID=515351 RepID=UPI000408DF12|nr:hypothetical protein [Lacticigenium naphthae]